MIKKLFHYRWFIGAFLILICVFFEIHGSSLGIYSQWLATPNIDIFGHFRPIRSDEWWVQTPLAFSQYYNDFRIFSDIVRGTATDMTMVYSQPVWDTITLFRPFQLGYLVFPIAKGLAFFWMARWIILFLVSLEFGLLIFRKNKAISLCYGISIAFAPAVQWWFAVCYLPELLIFGQLAILSLNKYLQSNGTLIRIFYCGLLFWSVVTYALSLYPAWQVTFAYIFLVCAIWVIYENNKEMVIQSKDYIILGIILIIACCLTAAYLYRSYDTVKIVKQTVYPGARFITGDNLSIIECLKLTFNYLWGILLPKYDLVNFTNNCEAARFIDFAPLGIFLVGWQWIKRKNVDLLVKLLLLILFVYYSWILFKWPAFIAKISLLSNVTGARIVLGIGFLNLLIFFRELAIHQYKIKNSFSILFSLLIGLALTYVCYAYYPIDKKIIHYILIFTSSFLVWFTVLTGRFKIFIVLYCAILLLSGGRVNPIARGTDSIYKSNLVKEIEYIAKEDKDALWIVESNNSALNNVPIMVGARTINSINAYPALDRWESIDKNKEFINVYNKYAHIYVKTSNSLKNKKFLDRGDGFEVTLSSEDLHILNVSYLLSSFDKQHYISMGLNVSELYNQNGLKIYRLNY